MSWKPEVQTDLTGQWHGNGLRFLTHKEAEATARNLMRRGSRFARLARSRAEIPSTIITSKEGLRPRPPSPTDRSSSV
jgi:hypothetical protein